MPTLRLQEAAQNAPSINRIRRRSNGPGLYIGGVRENGSGVLAANGQENKDVIAFPSPPAACNLGAPPLRIKGAGGGEARHNRPESAYFLVNLLFSKAVFQIFAWIDLEQQATDCAFPHHVLQFRHTTPHSTWQCA